MNKSSDKNQSGTQSYVQAAQNTASQAVDGLSGVLKCMILPESSRNLILTYDIAAADTITGQAKSNTK